MSGKQAVFGVLFLVASTIAGVVDISRPESNSNSNSNKETEKKPNIVKDYVCLRDGELCHPNFGGNRGMYVSCSNGVAWEQQCPRCTYHPLTCPTRTLWFDGEKCEWASPKLASQPCIDRFPAFELQNGTEKEASAYASNGLAEQEGLLQSLQSSQGSVSSPMKESQPDKGKWPGNSVPPPMYFKSPKSGGLDNEPAQEIDVQQLEVKSVSQNSPSEAAIEDLAAAVAKNRRKSAVDESSESDFPNYLSAEGGALGSKIQKLNEPVYALVNSPDGSGKQVLMRVFQPFVFEDAARTFLPNYINPYYSK